MIRKRTALLGAGIIMAGLSLPLAASAERNDETLAFALGTAVGYAAGDHGAHVQFVHRPHYNPYYRDHRGIGHHRGWDRHPHRWDHRWQRAERRHHGFQHRYDRHHYDHHRGDRYRGDRYHGDRHRGDRYHGDRHRGDRHHGRGRHS